MKKFDHNALQLCKLQGALFSKSCEKITCSSAVFVRRFMNSMLAHRMDEGSVLFEAISTQQMFCEIEEEYGKSSYGSEKYSTDELYWMGYVYRYWSACFEETSVNVFKNIGARELRLCYNPYHSLDPEQAIRRIAEEKEIILDANPEDLTKRGVKILRKIRENDNFDYYVSKI